MAKEEPITADAVIVDTMPNATFKAELEGGHIVTVHVSGKIRKNNIKVLLGDKVQIEMSPYDLSKGRITFRY